MLHKTSYQSFQFPSVSEVPFSSTAAEFFAEGGKEAKLIMSVCDQGSASACSELVKNVDGSFWRVLSDSDPKFWLLHIGSHPLRLFPGAN